MSQQMPLIPVSQHELNESAFRLAKLLEEEDLATAEFGEAKKAYKEHLGAIRREVSELRATIRRAQLEAEEGLMARQVDALINHREERRD